MHRHLDDDEVAALPVSAGRAELLEQIMDTPVRDAATPVDDPARGARRRRWTVPLAAAACVAVLATAASVPLWSRGEDEGGVGADANPTNAPTAPAATGPYVVLDAPGWRVDDLYPGDSGQDEMTYARGDLTLDVNVFPERAYAGYVEDRENIVDPPAPGEPVEALGQEGQLWPYSARDHTVILQPRGGTAFEFRGEGMDQAAFVALLGDLRRVDRSGFEASLPADFVRPEAVQDILDGITGALSPRWALVPFGEEDPTFTSTPADPYQLGAEVSGAVACRWIAAYSDALANGDDASASDAADAMATARRWPVLDDMAAEGDYPEVVWEYADAMAAGEDVQGFRGGLGCP